MLPALQQRKFRLAVACVHSTYGDDWTAECSEQYAQAVIGDRKVAYLKFHTLGAIGMKQSMHFFIIGFSFSIDQTTHAASDTCEVRLQAVQDNCCVAIAAIAGS